LTKPQSRLLGTTLKVFIEDVDGKTPTSMEINFLHKSEHNFYKSLVMGLAHCERPGYSLPCIKYCFHGPDQKILTVAGSGKACLIFKREHGFQKICYPLQVWKILLMICSRLLELK